MTVGLSPLPVLQFNQGGIPLAGGLLFTYEAGSVTKLASYIDSTGITPNTNPIVLDANGQCSVWLTENVGYKLVLAPATDTDPPTNPYWTEDNVFGQIVGLSAVDAGQGITVSTTDGVATISVTNASITNAMLATMPADTIKTNPAGSTGAPQDETSTAFIARKNLGTANIVQVVHPAGTYTAVAGDENKEHAFSGNGTFIIQSQASNPLPPGSFYKITAFNTTVVTLQINTDTIYWLPSSATGTRTITGRGFAVVTYEGSDAWWLAGASGVS